MIPKIRVAVVRSCEMQCIYCPRTPVINMENYDGAEKYCMTIDELIGILLEMQKYGLQDVHLTGGEPLHRGDLATLISCLTAKGFKVELNTNGVGLTKNRILKIKEAGVKFLKISLDAPNRELFFAFTGLDAFERVIQGIETALTIMPVRLNCVVMRSNLGSIIPLLKLCNDLGVQEIHLLDLTYYPGAGEKTFWEREFVYLTQELKPIIEAEYSQQFELLPIYGCRFYRLQIKSQGTAVILKEAQPTMRIPACADCQEYCHEGVFTLRLSAGGYLNFCPGNNNNGINALTLYRNGTLGDVMSKLSQIFEQAGPVDSFQQFLDQNSLNFPGGQDENMLS
ncbi:MAG: radical SAM protein [Patescibacteria group bacterium]